MVPDIGQRYGPYEILSRIGGGGMGHVYRAWDARLHREVAIKLLHNEYSMPGMRERFLREARAASALNHPNICTIFDIGEQGGDPYLVMEMLQGVTLKQRIQYEAIQVDQLLTIAREIAEALIAAHAKGVVHRDVKPANIFLVERPNGGYQAKVLDFGLAKFEGGTLGGRGSRALDLTAAGATVGTLAYMSPEQARGEALDARSDLFSLGVVMYEMATRRIPFTGATSALVFVQLLNQPPEPVRDWNDAIPRELEKIILKLMAKDRTQRFQTAQDLEAALSRISEKGSGGWFSKVAVPLVRAPEPIAREKRISRRRDREPVEAEADEPATPVPEAAVTHSRPAQVLRPVARLPSSVRPTQSQYAAPQRGAQAAVETPVPASAQAGPAGADRSLSGWQAQPGIDLAATEESVRRAATVPGESRHGAHDSSDSAAFALGQPFFAGDKPARAGGPEWLTPLRMALIAGGVCLLPAAFFLLRPGHPGEGRLPAASTLAVTQIENRTGDRTLDGVASAGLQIAIEQSPLLMVPSPQAYRLARAQVLPSGGASVQWLARKTAERLGTNAYIVGWISGSTAPYTLHADLVKTLNNDVVSSVEEQAATVQDLPATIDRVAAALRARSGEDKESIRRSSIPLSHEGTDNLGAVNALGLGEDAFAGGDLDGALRLFQQAARLDPQFIQTQLRLIDLYRMQHADVAAAEAAKAARAVADAGSDRTRALAEYEFEMNATGDYNKAVAIIRKLLTARPHDAAALDHLARGLRLQGRIAESLQNAQQAYAEDAFDLDAYVQAQWDLIALDRYEAASQLGRQVKALGIGSLPGDLIAGYLQGRQDEVDAALETIADHKGGFRPDWNLGLYRDNVGQLAAAGALWRERSQAALQVPGLESTAAFLLAQGATDRAQLGDCAAALPLAHDAETHPQGAAALFNLGMAYALCGDAPRARHAADVLQQMYPQSFAVRGFYVADLQAAIALSSGDAAAALEILKPAQQYDLISQTPLLRARAHVALRQVQVGIVDFQTVLAHRGLPFVTGSVAYAVARIGLARAFAATGDTNNSASAYRSFLQLWHAADARQPLVAEAFAHSR